MRLYFYTNPTFEVFVERYVERGSVAAHSPDDGNHLDDNVLVVLLLSTAEAVVEPDFDACR